MTDKTLEVFVAVYSDEKSAGVALNDLKAMERDGSIHLVDAAVVVRDAEGKVHYEETADPSGKKWAKRGAIAGGVVGLIFPPTLIASAIVGGGAGGLWGKIRDKGFKDEDLKAVGEEMDPGTSAIIAIAEDHVIERLENGLEGYEKIAKHAVSAEAATAIAAEGSEQPATVSRPPALGRPEARRVVWARSSPKSPRSGSRSRSRARSRS